MWIITFNRTKRISRIKLWRLGVQDACVHVCILVSKVWSVDSVAGHSCNSWCVCRACITWLETLAVVCKIVDIVCARHSQSLIVKEIQRRDDNVLQAGEWPDPLQASISSQVLQWSSSSGLFQKAPTWPGGILHPPDNRWFQWWRLRSLSLDKSKLNCVRPQKDIITQTHNMW